MKSIVLSFLLALVACGDSAVQPIGTGATPPTVGVPPEAGCGVAFKAPDSLLVETQEAATRWSLATGCNIRIEETGIPIISMEVVQIEKNHELVNSCGATYWDEMGYTRYLAVSSSARCDTRRVILHEIGHALAGHADHSASCVMSEYEQDSRCLMIDENSLTTVCKDRECKDFRPESET
jgi:hypothetical protein